jgi:branched-chain amino acid transport system substrate-binding protein
MARIVHLNRQLKRSSQPSERKLHLFGETSMLPNSSRCLCAAIAIFAASLVASVAKGADVIKIGAPLALTGALADESKKQERVWEMWLARVNAAGGINIGGKKKKVELIKRDYQSNGQRGAELAEKLITDDKVDFLFAPFGSGHTKIVATVAERYQTPVIACSASTESVFNQGNKYLFGTLSPNGASTDGMVAYFKKAAPSVKTIAILGRDDVFPKSMAKGMSDASNAAGLSVVYDQLYAVGTIDHSASVSAIKAAAPDWIYVTGYTQDLILIRKQLADLGVKAKIITMITGPAYKEFTDGLGNLANDVTSWTWWTHYAKYKGVGIWPTTEAFYDDFASKTGSDPDYIHGSCAAGAELLQNAIERAGSTDKTKVRDELASTDIVTFYGPIKFSPNGMNQPRNVPIIQVQSGKVKVLQPDEIKNADLVLIK